MSQKMNPYGLKDYYNRFDAAKNYDEVLFRDLVGAQAADHNDLQGIFSHKLKYFGDALFKDGDIINGAQIIVDPETGAVTAQEGVIYCEGSMRPVLPATFVISTVGTVAIGIRLKKQVITELDDPELYNPAVGSDTQGEKGSCRLKVTAEWGVDGDGGSFYPVHVVEDGVVRAKEAPPNLDSFNQGIARYDRDSTGGGTYIVTGLVLRASQDNENGDQVYTVSEGRARVYGYGIELPTSRRLTYAAKPDLRHIETEVHTAEGVARQRINVAHAPISGELLVRATLRKTVSLVHGSYSGVSDALPDTSVVKLLQCKQGDTVYDFGTDYKKTGDAVDWSPLGAEPAPGSTYECTYTYMATIEPVDPDFDGFTVEGAVADSSILVTYKQALPRMDILCITQEGAFQWQKGVAAEFNQRKPTPPQGVLAIATVQQTWREHENRKILNDGIRVCDFETLETMSQAIDSLRGEMARNRLESNITARENGHRVGIMVDPCLDDSVRDQGISQTAAVFGGELTLPIDPSIHALPAPRLLPIAPRYVPSFILTQTLRTGSMKVNPYMSFAPVPPRIKLDPSIDQWTETETKWTSAVTQFFGWGLFAGVISQNQLVASETSNIANLRQIPVDFVIEGFGPHEKLRRVMFDGIQIPTIPAEITADENGKATGSFVVPPNVPAGSKRVTFHGLDDGGSLGTAVFIGQGKLTVQTMRTVNTFLFWAADPLAQTFTLERDAQICGIDLWFTACGGDVTVQLREVQNGKPSRTIIAETFIPASSIVVSGGGHTRVEFPIMVQLLAGAEYSVVILCDDAVTSLAIAEMGGFDSLVQKWVSAQPYTIGVLLSSSNGTTWTAHQDKDLTFRLLESVFTPGVHPVEMGSVTVENMTDLVVVALEETPTSETRVEYEVSLPDGNTLNLAQGQPVRMSSPLTGEVAIKAKMTCSRSAGPLLWPGAQLVTGSISQQGDYYTRSIPAFGATQAILIYDAYVPSGSTVTPEIQIDSGEWQTLELDKTIQQGDGVVEYTFRFNLTDADLIKTRFTLTGSTSARPSVRDIRFMAIR